MRQGEAAFIDSGAWIALALSRDPLHAAAREQWDLLLAAGAKRCTSVPVVIETFTFLERNANFQAETGLDPDLFRAEGGAVPLFVRDEGRVGTLVVSGLEGWEDHALAVGGLERWLGKA